MDFSSWYRAAQEKAAALHLDTDALLEAHALVVDMLGEKWCAKLEKEAGRDRSFHELHPLYIWLRSSAEVALVEVAELAKYLAEFRDDPAIEGLLAHLRARADIEPTVFELAMAYRWKRAGATVTLAPILPTGKTADFSAEVDNVVYTAEVSASPRRMLNLEAASFAKTALKTIRSAGSDHDHIAIELVLTSRLPNVDLHGPVVRAVREAIRNLTHGAPQRNEIELPFGVVVARKIPDDRDDDAPGKWHHRQQLMLQDPGEDGSEYDAHKNATVGRGCAIYVRLPNNGTDLYDLLLGKFNYERKQLASIENRVIILDASGVKADALTLNMSRVNDTIGQALLSDDKTSAVWIATRGFSEYLRPTYRIATMSNPNAISPLSAQFGEQMSEQERHEDIITGSALDWQPTRRFEDPIG